MADVKTVIALFFCEVLACKIIYAIKNSVDQPCRPTWGFLEFHSYTLSF